jgi:hypothetical protein
MGFHMYLCKSFTQWSFDQQRYGQSMCSSGCSLSPLHLEALTLHRKGPVSDPVAGGKRSRYSRGYGNSHDGVGGYG